MYYYNNEPLQLSYRNNYTTGEKIEIVLQLQNDLKVGMLSAEQMRWIVDNKRFGAFTVQKEIDRLMFEGKIKIITDASAAKGITMRRGLGQVRHFEVNQLWIQDRVASKSFEIRKVGTDKNVSDILTKTVTRSVLDKQLEIMGFRNVRPLIGTSMSEKQTPSHRQV